MIKLRFIFYLKAKRNCCRIVLGNDSISGITIINFSESELIDLLFREFLYQSCKFDREY